MPRLPIDLRGYFSHEVYGKSYRNQTAAKGSWPFHRVDEEKAFLTRYAPEIWRTTNSESNMISKDLSFFSRLFSSPRIRALYSATLFVASPIALEYSRRGEGEASEAGSNRTPIAAGPGFPREAPSQYKRARELTDFFFCTLSILYPKILRTPANTSRGLNSFIQRKCFSGHSLCPCKLQGRQAKFFCTTREGGIRAG